MTATVFVVVLVALLVGVVVLWRSWRNVQRELAQVEVRLTEITTPTDDSSLDAALAHLDDVARRAHEEGEQARIEAAQFAAALRASRDGVVIADADGAVILRNPAAQRFSGARHAEAIAEGGIAELLDRARLGDAAERELQLFGPPRMVLQLRAEPLRRADDIVGAVVFVRDVSESRRVESVRRDFVANVSHELKTPIGALALLAETMAAGGDPSITRQLAERVQREADRLGRIIDDLLDLSLIEAQEAPTRQPVPVEVLVSDAIERVRAAAEVAGIPLQVSDVGPGLVVEVDPRQVVGAVANLLDNAVKYSEPGQPVELDVTSGDERLVILVRDHGIGIPSRDLERIFERFYRVDRARSRKTGGTGLGLSIVRHVAQAHGGEVTVESHEGEGSAFRLELPLAPRRERKLSTTRNARDAS